MKMEELPVPLKEYAKIELTIKNLNVPSPYKYVWKEMVYFLDAGEDKKSGKEVIEVCRSLYDSIGSINPVSSFTKNLSEIVKITKLDEVD